MTACDESGRRHAGRSLGLDDELERRVRLLLLDKGAVLAHRFDRPRAAEMDETEQRPTRDPD
jgi:hypothetical protein